MDTILLVGYIQRAKILAEKVMKRVPELIAELPEFQELMLMLHGKIMVKSFFVIQMRKWQLSVMSMLQNI